MAKQSKAKASNSSMAAVRLTANLVAALAVGVGAWFASPALVAWLKGNVAALNAVALGDLAFQLIVAGVVFLLGIMVVSLLIAAILPKDSRTSNEREIAKEQAAQFAARRKKLGRKGAMKREKR